MTVSIYAVFNAENNDRLFSFEAKSLEDAEAVVYKKSRKHITIGNDYYLKQVENSIKEVKDKITGQVKDHYSDMFSQNLLNKIFRFTKIEAKGVSA